MTAQSYRLKISRVNSLKLKVQPRYPVDLLVGDFLTLTKENGVYTFGVDYSKLTPGPISDPATAYVAIEDKASGIYREVSLASLLTSGLDADLQAIAALTSAGVLVRTADDTWSLRTVTGTANEISVTDGDGVSGNPTVSLPSALTFTNKTVTGGTYMGAVSFNKITVTEPATGSTLTIADGKTLTASNNATVSGTNTGDQTITLTGDITGSGTGSFATTIGANKVTNAKLAAAADGTIKSNISGSTAAPSDNTISAVLDKLFGTTQGSIIYRGSSSWAALTPGTSGNFLKTQGASANPVWASIPGGGDMLSTNNLSDVANAATARSNLSAAKSGANSDITSLSALTNAALQVTASNPTGTTSTSDVMAGVGTSCHITPVASGRLLVHFQGDVFNSTVGNVSAQIRYGTGTAPANGVPATGTAVGSKIVATVPTASYRIPIHLSAVITGLTPGTAYWFDLGFAPNTGTGTTENISCSIMEF